MFIGEYEHSVDDKGRIAVPKRLRGHFGQGLVLTRGWDRCLWIYTPAAWDVFSEKISHLPVGKSNARSLSRMIFSGAVDCDLDQQGRIVIPSYLRQYAQIGAAAVVLGVNDRLEIWARDLWEQAKAEVEGQSGALAEQLASLGVL